jgi:hypothetical protein
VYGPLTVTVTDSKGAKVSTQVNFVNATLNGSFDGHFGDGNQSVQYFTLDLKQQGTTITGIIHANGLQKTGIVDPAQAGQIDATGHFRLRFKLEALDDLTMSGQFVPDIGPAPDANYAGVGQGAGGAFDGQLFKFKPHDPY